MRVVLQLLARARVAFVAALAFLASPGFVAFFFLASGCAMLIAGVFMLLGLAWALIAGAAPVLLTGAVLLRGVIHGA